MKTPNMDRFKEGRPEPDPERLEEIRQDRADDWYDDRSEREMRSAKDQAGIFDKIIGEIMKP